MECTGVLHSVNRDWTTGKIIVSFQLNEEPTEAINGIQSCEKLSITAKQYKEKRSLDATLIAGRSLQRSLTILILRVARKKFTKKCCKSTVAYTKTKADIYLSQLKQE